MNRRHSLLIISIAAFCVTATVLETARAGPEIEWGDGFKLEFFQRIQLCNVYTLSDRRDDAGKRVDDRWDLYLRRARFGMRGVIPVRFGSDTGELGHHEILTYKVSFSYSNVGKDRYSGPAGPAEGGTDRSLEVFDAYLSWSADPTWANITAGFFRPQAGRENITAAFRMDSFVKALASNAVRQHLVGRGTGREMGLNVGGLYHPRNGYLGLNYNAGIFSTNDEDIVGTDGGGTHWAPLLAGRVALTIGEPEKESYGIRYSTNYFGARRGATFGVQYAHQDRTDLFHQNSLVGFDILANYDQISLSAEYDFLSREEAGGSYTDRVYHLRAGYNIPLGGEQYLVPAVMYSVLDGDGDSANWPGEEHTITSLGLNWYLDRVTKINLHYVWQGVPDDRGNFVGMGLQLVW